LQEVKRGFDRISRQLFQIFSKSASSPEPLGVPRTTAATIAFRMLDFEWKFVSTRLFPPPPTRMTFIAGMGLFVSFAIELDFRTF
jgi:hypothetical protein